MADITFTELRMVIGQYMTDTKTLTLEECAKRFSRRIKDMLAGDRKFADEAPVDVDTKSHSRSQRGFSDRFIDNRNTPPPQEHVPANRAAQITMGRGLVDVSRIDHEGRAGILFRPRERHIPVGDEGELKPGEYWPVEGDVVIWIENEGGAQVIQKYLTLFLSPQNLLSVEIDRVKAERNIFAGKYRSIIALMDDTRQKVQEIVDHIEDEGDRSYFGSSNHADWLRDLADDMTSWSFDAMLPKGDINKMERDPYAEIREQRLKANRALAALKDAVGHIEHMAAFIASQQLGYSFESLGEDMPGMKDAISATEVERHG